MPTNPWDTFMAQPGQPKKEVSPNPYANLNSAVNPPGVATGPAGRPSAPSGAGPAVAPTAPAPVQPAAPAAKPVQPAAQPGGGITIQVGQPAPAAPTPAPVEPAAPPATPAADAPYFVDPASGQRTQVSTPEHRAEYGRQIAARRAKIGPHPYAGDPNAPQMDIELGKPAYNAFTGQWS